MSVKRTYIDDYHYTEVQTKVDPERCPHKKKAQRATGCDPHELYYSEYCVECGKILRDLP
jgi:hypothetical protein